MVYLATQRTVPLMVATLKLKYMEAQSELNSYSHKKVLSLTEMQLFFLHIICQNGEKNAKPIMYIISLMSVFAA